MMTEGARMANEAIFRQSTYSQQKLLLEKVDRIIELLEISNRAHQEWLEAEIERLKGKL